MSKEEEFNTRDLKISDVVDDLAKALNEYAKATNAVPQSSDELIRLKKNIRDKIKAYQPLNTQDGIFDDVIALLPEDAMEQFVKIQFNILNNVDDSVGVVNENDYTLMESLAKRFLVGKTGLELFYTTAADSVEDKITKLLNEIDTLPPVDIPDIYEIKDTILKKKNDIMKSTADVCNKMKPHFNYVLNIIDLIQNTAKQLWNLTGDQYTHDIWGDREYFVNDDGTLADPIERIRQKIIIDFIKEQNEKCKGPDRSITLNLEYPHTDTYKTITNNLNKSAMPRSETIGPGIRRGGKSKKRRKSGKRKTRRKQKKRKTRRKRRCKK